MESADLGVGLETTGTHWGECNLERHETTGTKESENQGRPPAYTHRLEEAECLARGCLSTGWDREEIG